MSATIAAIRASRDVLSTTDDVSVVRGARNRYAKGLSSGTIVERAIRFGVWCAAGDYSATHSERGHDVATDANTDASTSIRTWHLTSRRDIATSPAPAPDGQFRHVASLGDTRLPVTSNQKAVGSNPTGGTTREARESGLFGV